MLKWLRTCGIGNKVLMWSVFQIENAERVFVRDSGGFGLHILFIAYLS